MKKVKKDYETLNSIIENIGMMDWRNVKSIEDSIYVKFGYVVSDRTWRAWVKKYNEQYENHLKDSYIARSNQGYVLTNRKDLVRDTCDRQYNNAISVLRHVYKTRKATGQKMNAKLELDLSVEEA